MYIETKSLQIISLLFILTLILAACQSPPASPEPVVETLVVTEVVEATPVEVIKVVTPTQEPGGPRTLVICVGFEPESLYKFGSQMPILDILMEAVEGGSIDPNSFAYHPVILEKLPNLADGDASLTVVTLREGDRVIDASGNVAILDPAADPPILLTPLGGGEPILYQGGEIEMEQISAAFKLLPGLLWSDGELLTASDSVYAYNLMSDPATPQSKFRIERTASYEAIDDLVTVWTGLPGFVDAEYYANFFSPAPEHLWGQYSAAELLEAEESHLKPIGWGPYMIDEWVAGESITLQKNPNYFRSAEGLPKFDTVVFRFATQGSDANIADLLAGECDIVDRLAIDENQIPLLLELHEAGQIKASFTTGTIWEHLDFGIQHADYDDGFQLGVDRPDFFSDVRTRRAFAMCMDRQALVDTLTLGQSIVVDTYLPPQHPLHNPDVRHYEFDVQSGGALLDEVGWVDDDDDPNTPRIAMGVANVPDGTRLELDLETTSGRSRMAAILQESLIQCGIQTRVKIQSGIDWFADGPEGALFGRKYDLGGFSWLTEVAPPCDLYLSSRTTGPAGTPWISVQDEVVRTFSDTGWSDQNNPGFANVEYDTACNTALGSLPDQPEYESAHLEAQRIFAEQLPVVPLYMQIKLSATRPDMCGLIMDPTNNTEFWNIEEFDYGEGCEE